MPKDMSKRVGFYTSSHSWRNLQHWQFVNSAALAGKGWDVTVITTGKDRLYKRLRNKGINVIVFRKTGFLLPDVIRLSSLLKKHEISTLFINYSRDLFYPVWLESWERQIRLFSEEVQFPGLNLIF